MNSDTWQIIAGVIALAWFVAVWSLICWYCGFYCAFRAYMKMPPRVPGVPTAPSKPVDAPPLVGEPVDPKLRFRT